MSAKAPTPPPRSMTDAERGELIEEILKATSAALDRACHPAGLCFFVAVGSNSADTSFSSNLPFSQMPTLHDSIREGVASAEKQMKERAAGMPSAQ